MDGHLESVLLKNIYKTENSGSVLSFGNNFFFYSLFSSSSLLTNKQTNKLKQKYGLMKPEDSNWGLMLTIISAGSRVFGVGLADDILLNLVPFILIIAPSVGWREIHLPQHPHISNSILTPLFHTYCNCNDFLKDFLIHKIDNKDILLIICICFVRWLV